jgi:hypothetical protein
MYRISSNSCEAQMTTGSLFNYYSTDFIETLTGGRSYSLEQELKSIVHPIPIPRGRLLLTSATGAVGGWLSLFPDIATIRSFHHRYAESVRVTLLPEPGNKGSIVPDYD